VDALDRLPQRPLVVPACDHLPPEAVSWIEKNKGDVIFVDRLPAEIESGNVVPLSALAGAIDAHLALSDHPKGLRIYHYKADEEAFMFFNEDMTSPVDVTAQLPAGAFYDADSDRYVEAGTGVRIFLQSGEACVYVAGKKADVRPVSGKSVALAPAVTGYATAEQYPAFGPLEKPEAEFSGTIAYTCEYVSDRAARAEVRIVECTEAVEVFINGVSQGMSIAPPYAVEVTLQRGKNDISVEVTNTLGNQQRAYDGGHFSGPSFAPALGILGEVSLVLEA
jgi:hypothetical protein